MQSGGPSCCLILTSKRFWSSPGCVYYMEHGRSMGYHGVTCHASYHATFIPHTQCYVRMGNWFKKNSLQTIIHLHRSPSSSSLCCPKVLSSAIYKWFHEPYNSLQFHSITRFVSSRYMMHDHHHSSPTEFNIYHLDFNGSCLFQNRFP